MFCILWHLSFWHAISFTSFHIWCLLVSFVCPSVYRENVPPVLYFKVGACICTQHTAQLHIENALRGYGSLCTILELCLSDAVFTCNIIHLPGVPMLMQCIQNHLKSRHLCVGGVGKVSFEYIRCATEVKFSTPITERQKRPTTKIRIKHLHTHKREHTQAHKQTTDTKPVTKVSPNEYRIYNTFQVVKNYIFIHIASIKMHRHLCKHIHQRNIKNTRVNSGGWWRRED